jgi:hypothetical protein
MEATLEQNAIGFQRVSGARITAGHVLSGLSSLFLLFDGILKLFKPGVVVNGTVELGYNESVIIPLGVLLTVITVLYLIPRTAVLGAVLLTGYLGGAVATHVRVGAGAFPIIFPVIVGALVWGGLYLRDARIAELLPLRK